MTRADQMRQDAEDFHARHPRVWRLFVEFTFQAIRAGHDHYSVGAIWERIRWETDMGDPHTRADFKLNNNHRAFYSRRLMTMYPDRAGFFRTRIQTSEGAPAVTLPPLGPQDFDEVMA